MELSEEAFHEIHQYLSGGGTPEERAAFEERMRADQALAGEVEVQLRIRNGLKANEYKNLFKDIHAQLENDGLLPSGAVEADPEQGKIVPLNEEGGSALRWPYFAAAASILIALGLIWYFNSLPTSTPVASDVPTVGKPAATDTVNQIQPSLNPDTVKTQPRQEQKKPQTLPSNVDRTDFFADYFNENVELESPFSKEKLGLSPSAFKQWGSDTAHVRQAVRSLAAQDSETALQELKQVETSRFPQVKNAAAWYIALAYLQRKDLKNCQEQLKKVAADPENQNRDKAVELLRKIK
ncbi:hypothetical protein [Dyadobacter sp. OTU695]|uniref:hypothetical protein n=1 Tax=Dyadobacter sp. OTU695 TaxID=3043860 RepID=UPI00313BD0C4